MTPAEAATLLAIAAGVDNRKHGEAQARMWARIIGDVSLADAIEAVERHYAESEKWLMPVHVIEGVKRIRAERLGKAKRAQLDAEIASENDGDYDPQPVESGVPAVSLAIEGPLRERLSEYQEGRREGAARMRAIAEEKAAKDAARKAAWQEKRAEIEAELAAVQPEASEVVDA